ncbi:MAG: hypothetical protein V1789_04135 [PVC group bacterium]
MRADEYMAREKIAGYFALLLAVLIIIFAPSFTNPPRSDWWSALFAFHLVDASPGPPGFSFVVNHDPWRDGTFRPVAHPVLYLEHRLFGADFLPYHLVNFAGYFLSIVLLYLLGKRLGIGTGTLALFLSLFAVLFTHADIVTWTFHVTMPLSFSAFLFGIIIYLRYSDGGNKLLLVPIGFLFLFSLLCLELFLLWPLGLLLISMRRIAGRRRPAVLMTAAVYWMYLLVFLVTRTAPHTSGSLSAPGAGDVFLSLCSVFFNLLYNGILINLLPFLALPLRVTHNIEMGGPAAAWSPGLLRTVVTATGSVSLVLFVLIASFRRPRRKIPAGLGLLFFLYAAGFFVLALGRSTTENFTDLFLQFRYQYIANAFLVLMGALAVDRLVRSGPVRRGISLLLILAVVFNVIAVRGAVNLIDTEMTPLKTLLGRIQGGIKRGEISPQQPLAMPDGIPSYLPSLCWNEDMGRFFRGTYQWIFSREEIFSFTPFIGDAAWVADGETLNYRLKNQMDPSVLPQRNIPSRYWDRAGSLSSDN